MIKVVFAVFVVAVTGPNSGVPRQMGAELSQADCDRVVAHMAAQSQNGQEWFCRAVTIRDRGGQ